MITRRQVIPPVAPVFEGRKLSTWLDDPSLTEAESRRALRALGTNALPQLQSWLERKPGAIERTVRGIDQRMDYLGIGYHPSLTANFRAMRGFLLLGEAAAPAVPWLEAGAARKDADFGFYLSALAVCGPDGWRALDRLETTATLKELAYFIHAAAQGVEHSPGLIARLVTYLEHPELTVRYEAYHTVRLLRDGCPPATLAALKQSAETEPDTALRELARGFVTQLTSQLADAQPTFPPKPESSPTNSVSPNPR
jgi:hypothetical protein